MTALALVTAVGGAVALLSCIATLLAMRKAYRLNKASRATYEAAYDTLVEASTLVRDAQAIADEFASGALSS